MARHVRDRDSSLWLAWLLRQSRSCWCFSDALHWTCPGPLMAEDLNPVRFADELAVFNVRSWPFAKL